MKERYLKPNFPQMRECAIYERVLRDRIFYMDYYPLGIFTVDNIPPSALEVIGHFDVNEDVPDFEL